MPTFRITAPDGRTFDITAPEGATKEEALQRIQAQYGQAEQPAPPELSPEQARDQALAEARQSQQQLQAGTTANLIRGAGGMANALNEVGQAGLDLVGWVTGSDTVKNWADKMDATQQDMDQASINIAQHVAGNIMGRAPSLEETAALTEKGKQAGEILGQIGIGGTGATATAAVAKGVLTTAPRVIAYGAADGALWGWLSGKSDYNSSAERVQERVGQSSLGGFLGGAFSAIPGILTSFKNWLGKNLGEAGDVAGRTQEAFKTADEFGVDINWGMASGRPTIQKLEADAMGDQAQFFLSKKGEEMSTAIANKLGVNLPDIETIGIGHYKKMTKIFDAFDEKVGKLKGIKNQNWDKQIAQARKLGGNKPLFDPQEFYGEIAAVQDDLARRVKTDKIPLSEEFGNILEEIKKAQAKGGASVDDIDGWWNVVNRWKAERSGLLAPDSPLGDAAGKQQVLAGKLSAALKRSVDRARAGTPEEQQAIDFVKAARDSYHEQAKAIQTLEDSFGQAFGAKTGNPHEIINKLGDADPVIVRRAVKTIKTMDGGEALIQQLKSGIMESAAFKATKAAAGNPAQAGDLDVKAFVQAFSANSKRSALAGLISPEEEKLAQQGIGLLRNVLNGQVIAKGNVVAKTTLPANFSDLAINMVSQDPGFVARLAAGAVQRGKGIENLLFTKEGINLLRSLQPRNPTELGKWNRARHLAVVALSEHLRDGAADKAIEEELAP